MKHVFCLTLLILIAIVKTQKQPSCPNGQLPKLDRAGRLIQCLPGSSSRSVCGINHICFFSGMNYMCCPSNEPSLDNQPTCPTPMVTVLDPHGLPLKCNPRSRTCPQERMTCSDVGLAYICCENVRDGLPLNAVITSERKRAPRRKPAKKVSAGMEESLDCPQNSIGLLKSDGSRVVCNSRSKCPGSNTFCHGNLKRSVCCERIEFASDILNSPIKTPSKDVAVTPVKKRDGNGTPKTVHAKSVMVSDKVEHSAVMTPVHKEPPKKKTVKNVSIVAPQEAKHFMDDTAQVTSSPKPPPSTTTEKVPSTSEAAATAPPSAGFSNQHVARDQAELQPPLPSQLFSKQDKRAMAQQFLMHQIRNGWPYDDRFYRPDLDAFSSEQRRDMARIQFSDN